LSGNNGQNGLIESTLDRRLPDHAEGKPEKGERREETGESGGQVPILQNVTHISYKHVYFLQICEK
jgi:hypothetical protein